MQELKNKVALVTGGSKGIGLGIAEQMVKQGINVAITSRSESAAQDAAHKLTRLGPGQAFGVGADVRDLMAQVEVVKKILDKWQRLDILIANAGVGHFGSIENLSADQWNETIDINLTGVFNSVKASLAAIKQAKGYIITIASLAGTNFFAGGTAYNASKFGLVGFTQALMMDVRNEGVKVTTIMPGSVATEFNNHQPSDQDAWKIQPEDIGKIVVDLLTMHPRTLPSKIEVRPSVPK